MKSFYYLLSAFLFLIPLSGFGRALTNYDNTLNGWATLTLQPNVSLGADGLQYNCGAAAARAILTGPPNNWTVTNGTCNSKDEVDITFENPAVSVSVDPVNAFEDGTGTMVYTFTRNSTLNAVTIHFDVGGTATFGSDYTQTGAASFSTTAGSVSMGVGESTATITIDPSADLVVEPSEMVILTLVAGTGYTVGIPNMAKGTIFNDDQGVVSVTNVSVAEGNSGDTPVMTFTVSMSLESDANVSVNYSTPSGTATENTDYQGRSGSLLFTPGQTSHQVTVPVNGDCTIEPDEEYAFRLSNLNTSGRNYIFSNAQSSVDGTGTIQNDDALPELSCGGNISKNTDPGVCQASVTLPVPGTNSLCGTSVLIYHTRTVDGNNNPTGPWSGWTPAANNSRTLIPGNYEVEWQVMDGSGTVNCSYYMTITDNEAPQAACKNITVQLDANGHATITPAQIDNGTLDNCSFTLGLDNNSFTCTDVGANTVNLTATDPAGLSHSCAATVTVEDKVLPVAQCNNLTVELNANGQGSITAAQVDNSSSDACGIASRVLDEMDFDCADIGSNTVTLTVTDVNNNVNTCTATITVEDNLDPVVACQNITIGLNPDGNVSITPAQVYNAADSEDNCGSINLVSVTPNQFTCLNEGLNMVTLTANDGNGNEVTCNATVTINDFITIVSVTHTDETCHGAGDGSITAKATAPGGQMNYSIDGGATWNYSGIFNHLLPGNYTITFKVTGVSVVCEETVVEVVGTDPNGVGQVWFKDIDDDGYTDGMAQVSCPQPSGYKLWADLLGPETDCNDYDANKYPGQTWYKDHDNDGYSDGVMQTACSQPIHYKSASQLIATSGDCDDTNWHVHPGVTEVCNGIDDDCDGEVDEGGTGLTWTGNVAFYTQADVDAWPPCYSIIDGNLLIQNSVITNLESLLPLVEVTRNVTIKITGLPDLTGLSNLTTIGGNLLVQTNNSMTSLDGLETLTTVGGSLKVYFNFNLTDCCAIHDLINEVSPKEVGGSITIFRNETGCDSQVEVNQNCGSGNIMAPVYGDVATPEVMAEPTVEEEHEAAELLVTLYPNPAHSYVNVSLSGIGGTGGDLILQDYLGRKILVQQLQPDTDQIRIDLSGWNLVRGEYVVQVKTNEGVVMERLIIF